MKSVDIIVPVYLCSPSLYPVIERCLRSIEFYYPDFNLILIDDCSPMELPDHWKKKAKIFHRNKTNLGFTATVNKGLDLSKSKVIILANDDLNFNMGDLDFYRELKDNIIAAPMDTASASNDRFGSIWGMTRNTYKKIGKLNEEYKHFYSDLDYYERAKKNDVKIKKYYEIVVEHMESATYSQLDKKSMYEIDYKKYKEENAQDY